MISHFGQVSQDLAYFIDSNEKIHLLSIGSDGLLSEAGVIEIFDDEIKERLGTEKMSLKVKTSVATPDGWIVVGFEQNIVIKYPINSN